MLYLHICALLLIIILLLLNTFVCTFVRTKVNDDETYVKYIYTFVYEGINYHIMMTNERARLLSRSLYVGIIIHDTATASHTSWLCITPQDCSFRARCTTPGLLRRCHSSGQQ